jgi:signal transduction histidine kinase
MKPRISETQALAFSVLWVANGRAAGLFRALMLIIILPVALHKALQPSPLFAQSGFAQLVAPTTQHITLDTATHVANVGLSTSILEDKTAALTLRQVLTPEYSAQFQPSTQERLSFGFSTSAYWVAFTVKNARPETASTDAWRLEIGYSPLDSITIFSATRQGQWQSRLYGDYLPFSERGVAYRNFIIPLELTDSLPHTYYIRVRSTSSMQIPMDITRTATLAERMVTSELGYGVLYGMLFVMIGFNLFLFAALRRPHYIWYVVYISGLLLYYMVLNGHAFQYFWPHFPRLANYMNLFAVGLSITGLGGFTRSFLPLYQLVPFADKIMRVLMWLGLVMLLVGIIAPYTLVVRTELTLVTVEVFTALVGGILCWARGNKPARYFVIAVAMFVVGNLLFVLKTVGVLPPNVITNHAVELGSALESVLLALALADRYRTLRLEKEAAQQEALQVQREANETLEQKVRERTDELERSNYELQRQMQILDEQANEIEIVNTTLQENNLKLQTLNEEKNEILSVVAHDLKNPLTTIAMNSSMVKNYFHRMSAEQSLQLVGRIESTAERMHNIILKLLDVNALDAGHIKLTIEDVELAPVLKLLVEEYQTRAAAKNITLRLFIDDNDCRVRTDIYRLQEVLENLISNALKFSLPDRTVTVALVSKPHEVRALQERARQRVNVNTCLIAVQDEGPGLSEEDKQKLFGKFARLSAQPTGGESSTGLGLAIVKKISLAMDGNVWCESSKGAGATFTVQIPRASAMIVPEAIVL